MTKRCRVCHDGFDAEDVNASGVCRWCADKEKFSAFAKSCGLTAFPDPSGERYVYHLDGDCAGKKGECMHFMDELWDALVKAKGGGDDLLLGKS